VWVGGVGVGAGAAVGRVVVEPYRKEPKVRCSVKKGARSKPHASLLLSAVAKIN